MGIKQPLFIVTGASGSGKTYVVGELRAILPDYDVFDLDAIGEFTGQDWALMRNIWLRVASHTASGGRRTVLCGTMMPWDTEKCADFHRFSHVYYFNLHCRSEIRENRLRARNWTEDLIQEHQAFAQWLLDNADKAYDPPMPTVDTSEMDVTEVAVKIKAWIERCGS